ncbi:MAG: diguanylate cyclase [Motiliproteus sp.]|nr:diguanylate cyclase [Motiliproteus sp.]
MSASSQTSESLQHLLKSLFQFAELGLVIVDNHDRIIDANTTLEQMFGCQAGELNGESAQLFWIGPNADKYQQDYKKHLKRQLHWQGEVLCKSSLGRIFPVEMRWLQADGSDQWQIGIFQDLTERRRWQSQLLEQRDRAERFLQISQAMILSLDTQGQVVEINRRGCELLGYPEAFIIGKPWFELAIPESQRQQQQNIFDRLLSGQLPQSQELEGEVVTKDGSIRHIIWNHSLVQNELNEITGSLSSGHDNTRRKEAEQEIMRLAMTDHLTGLVNRRSFYMRFNEAIKIADRSEIFISVITFDLDHFKPINDRYGHDIGDKVLVRVAEILQETFRESDTVGRMGGDEFAVIAIGTHNYDEIRPPLERLLKALSQPMEFDDISVRVGASIGIALFPDHGKDPDQLLRKADMALYEAKRKGRNCIQLYNINEDNESASNS